jgi:hypothetical protein
VKDETGEMAGKKYTSVHSGVIGSVGISDPVSDNMSQGHCAKRASN